MAAAMISPRWSILPFDATKRDRLARQGKRFIEKSFPKCNRAAISQLFPKALRRAFFRRIAKKSTPELKHCLGESKPSVRFPCQHVSRCCAFCGLAIAEA
jgi:hypothetical protein